MLQRKWQNTSTPWNVGHADRQGTHGSYALKQRGKEKDNGGKGSGKAWHEGKAEGKGKSSKGKGKGTRWQQNWQGGYGKMYSVEDGESHGTNQAKTQGKGPKKAMTGAKTRGG